jgi:hypothetical protein
MELISPPFWILPFGSRQVGVALHEIRGLIVFDPRGQRNLPEGKIRVYCARPNELFVLFEKHAVKHFRLPRSEKQSWLALYGYKAFLNPTLKRPETLDAPPLGQLDDEMEYAPLEGAEPESPEMELIVREISEDQDAWARSEEEGWYYED